MTTLITSDRNGTRLDSGLNETAFGRTNLVQRIRENGYLITAEPNANSGSPGIFRFEPWCFTQTETDPGSEGHVFFTGPGFSGRTLAELFRDDPDRAGKAAVTVCQILTQAVHESIPLPENGAGGILVSEPENNELLQLLFLPSVLFDNAAMNAGPAVYAEIQGFWQYKGYQGPKALSFIRAVLAYRILTNTLPYPAENPDDRLTDICDGNFMPVKYRINGINEKLAAVIDAVLDSVHRKKTDMDPEDFPDAVLEEELSALNGTRKRDSQIPDTEFKSKSASVYKKLNRRITLKRTVRRHRVALIAGIVLAAVLITGGINLHTAAGNRPVSTGLTSFEALQSFYEGMNTQDTELMQAMGSGHSVTTYINSVSGIFVAGKMRQAYENVSAPVPPAKWFSTGCSKKQPVYGLTNFTIDGIPQKLVSSAPLRKTKPEPVTTENGKKLEKGSTAAYTVKYYIVYSRGTDFSVDQYTDSVTMTYKNDRWIITAIEGTVQEQNVDTEKFRQTLESVLNTYKGYTAAASEALRSEWKWIPAAEK